VPPKPNGEYVWRMEDVIKTYMLPYDPKRPVICLDEASRQLFGEVREAQGPKPGSRAKIDYEYERKGTCNLFVMCEPLRGWRHVEVTARRTKRDYAGCVKDLVDAHYPDAEKILLVQDNLNTHNGGSLYERFAPAEARRLLDRIEFHYTPKHGSWLNMAETEIGIVSRQCLARRLECRATLAAGVAAWEKERNARQARIHWTFTLAVARQKMHKLYPTIEG
jgi:hypothetical protein